MQRNIVIDRTDSRLRRNKTSCASWVMFGWGVFSPGAPFPSPQKGSYPLMPPRGSPSPPSDATNRPVTYSLTHTRIVINATAFFNCSKYPWWLYLIAQKLNQLSPIFALIYIYLKIATTKKWEDNWIMHYLKATANCKNEEEKFQE